MIRARKVTGDQSHTAQSLQATVSGTSSSVLQGCVDNFTDTGLRSEDDILETIAEAPSGLYDPISATSTRSVPVSCISATYL